MCQADIELFASIVKQRGLSEGQKTTDPSKLAGRIMLLHEALARGLRSLAKEHNEHRS